MVIPFQHFFAPIYQYDKAINDIGSAEAANDLAQALLKKAPALIKHINDNAIAGKFNKIKEASHKLSKMAAAAGAQQISLVAGDIYLECYTKHPSAQKIKIMLGIIRDNLNKITSIITDLNI